MKIIRSLIVIFTLIIGLPSVAMECEICYEPISVERPRVAMCPSTICANAHSTCKACWFDYLKKNHVCPYGCGNNLILTDTTNLPAYLQSDLASPILLSRDTIKFALAGLSVAVLPWIVHYWSKYRLQSKLHALNSAASVKTDMLLGFEFDCDGDSAAFLGLQESFDIARILQGITTDEQRTALQTAIEHYDVSLRNAYDRIVSTYYYQPAANFAQKEPQLVQELNTCTEQINQLIMDYAQDMGNPMRNMFLGIGVGVLSGIGIFKITKS